MISAVQDRIDLWCSADRLSPLNVAMSLHWGLTDTWYPAHAYMYYNEITARIKADLATRL
jgi:hypothetical protein